MCIESDELIVPLRTSLASSTKGSVNISSELLAVKLFVLKIWYVAEAELSVTSKVTVGVFPVLFVTLKDLTIIVSQFRQ